MLSFTSIWIFDQFFWVKSKILIAKKLISIYLSLNSSHEAPVCKKKVTVTAKNELKFEWFWLTINVKTFYLIF